MIFIYLYILILVDLKSISRIEAQLVRSIGFLGAGVILKEELDYRMENQNDLIYSKRVLNLTTAASI
jgi:uncharacterized membrane protein YhiD involved in acid resistance